MYRFLTVKGSCGQPYDVGACQEHANTMSAEGYDLVQVYQTSTSGCFGGTQSVLVMVFRRRT
jgi:hypothetical protein